MSDNQGILLESGNNEMELLEFYLGKQSFGINVAKVRQLVPYDPKKVTRMVGAHEFVMGTVLWLKRSILLVDLTRALRMPQPQTNATRIILITEFNNAVTAFLVDGVNRIHRVNWKSIQSTSHYMGDFHVPVVATVTVDKKDILLVDLEQIMAETRGSDQESLEQRAQRETTAGRAQAELHLMLAEDSATVRDVVVRTLHAAGYTNVHAHEDGGTAYEHIARLKHEADQAGKPLNEMLSLIISDIEMPQMDGLTLCKRVKHEISEAVPVILYSSLVSDAMTRKCQSVGADGSCSKADPKGLVKLIDDLLLAA